MKNSKSAPIGHGIKKQAAALICFSTMAVMAGCATSPVNDYYEDEVQLSGTELGLQNLLDGKTSLDGLSRIDLAKAANQFDLIEPDDARAINISGTSTATFLPGMAIHEESIVKSKSAQKLFGLNTDKRKVRNLNQQVEEYDAQPISSVQNELPVGWSELENGLLHENSGMICPFGLSAKDDEFAVRLERIRMYDDKNEDVSCAFTTNTGALITIFSSYWPKVSQADHAESAARAIASGADGVTIQKTTSVVVPTVKTEDGQELEKPVGIGFEGKITKSKREVKTSLWLVKTKGWHVKARATHLIEDPLTEIFTVLLFVKTHLDVHDKNEDSLDGIAI